MSVAKNGPKVPSGVETKKSVSVNRSKTVSPGAPSNSSPEGALTQSETRGRTRAAFV